MRGLWVDAGNDPAYGKAQPYGIDSFYFDPRDPRLTSSYLDGVKAHAGIVACGMYVAWNWHDPILLPEELAQYADSELRRIGWRGNLEVCFDIEKGDGLSNVTWLPYCLATLRAWRKLRPKRRTFLTFEGMQGGLITAAAATEMMAMQVYVAPAMYDGLMQPHRHDVTQDLLIMPPAFAGNFVVGMYDAAVLPYRWQGFAFTQGRLP